MDELTTMIAQTRLNVMLKGSHFDICAVRDIGAAMNIPVEQSPDFSKLRALHCVHYKDMPRELIDALPTLLGNVFRVDPIEVKLPVATQPEAAVISGPGRILERLISTAQRIGS